MLSFLQGFAIGLMIMTGPWLLAGMYKPEWVSPDLKPNRFKVFLRYGVAVPFTCLVLGLTSLWGGFGASILGWLSGLAALFIAVPVERRLRKLLQRRQRRLFESLHREQVDVDLQRDAKYPDADSIIKQLNAIREQLAIVKVDVDIPERFYSRYTKLHAVLSKRFQPNELAMQRAKALIKDVYTTRLHQLNRFVEVQQQLKLLDVTFIERQLADSSLVGVAREALLQRQSLAATLQLEANASRAEFEKTLTALDATWLNLSQLNISQLNESTSSHAELEQALEALERFNQRLSNYETKHSGLSK